LNWLCFQQSDDLSDVDSSADTEKTVEQDGDSSAPAKMRAADLSASGRRREDKKQINKQTNLVLDEVLKEAFGSIWLFGPLADKKRGVLGRMRNHFVDRLGLMASTKQDVVLDHELTKEFLQEDEDVGRANAPAWMRALKEFEEAHSEASSQRTPRRDSGTPSSASGQSTVYGPSLYMQNMLRGQQGVKRTGAAVPSTPNAEDKTFSQMLARKPEGAEAAAYRNNFTAAVRYYE